MILCSMKYILTIATLALLGQTEAFKIQSLYADSEGPTKADNGENDDGVVVREEEDDPKSKWKNPLGRSDEGDADDDVILQTFMQTDGTLMALTRTKKIPKRRIYDEDGDGVEDNVEKTRDELDRFYEPAVFGVAEEINNTHHGSLPGHVRLEEYETAPTYHSPYSDEDYIGQEEDLHLHI